MGTRKKKTWKTPIEQVTPIITGIEDDLATLLDDDPAWGQDIADWMGDLDLGSTREYWAETKDNLPDGTSRDFLVCDTDGTLTLHHVDKDEHVVEPRTWWWPGFESGGTDDDVVGAHDRYRHTTDLDLDALRGFASQMREYAAEVAGQDGVDD